MKFVKTDKRYVVKLIKGEKVMEKLLEFCESQNLKSGFLTGIGGASEIQLGYYNLETKEYEWKTFSEVHEVLGLNGNISLVNNKPFIHAHMTVSNSNLQSFGGHLKEATVGATLEVVIDVFDLGLERKLDDEIGLKLLDFPED